jgi:hypothetical protein
MNESGLTDIQLHGINRVRTKLHRWPAARARCQHDWPTPAGKVDATQPPDITKAHIFVDEDKVRMQPRILIEHIFNIGADR